MRRVIGCRTSVSRSVVALAALPMLVCATITVFVVAEFTRLEFDYAIGVSDSVYRPALVNVYHEFYPWGWAGPILAGVILIALMCRSKCSAAGLICYVHFVMIFMMSWLAFSGSAFYLANQSFWGWRRVVKDDEVFAEKSFRPGEGPLVPGGDDVLPGELIHGKWDNARSVLRSIAGNPGPERLAPEKEGEEAGIWRDEESKREKPPK